MVVKRKLKYGIHKVVTVHEIGTGIVELSKEDACDV